MNIRLFFVFVLCVNIQGCFLEPSEDCCCLHTSEGPADPVMRERKACNASPNWMCLNKNECSSSSQEFQNNFKVTSFTINNPIQFSLLPKNRESIDLPVLKVNTTQELNNPVNKRYQCDIECTRNGNCQYFSTLKFNNTLFSESFSKTKQLLRENTSIIKKTELMKAFNVPNDSCKRSDINISEEFFENSGSSCVIRSSEEKNRFSFEISLPTKLVAFQNTNISKNTYEFSNSEMAPKIIFLDDLLNYESGGVIKSISLENKFLYLETLKGCLSYEVSPSIMSASLTLLQQLSSETE